MKHHVACIWGGMWVVVCAPIIAFAQGISPVGPGCCLECAQPAPQCHCVRTRPVVQTEWRAEPVTTLRNVTETCVKQEAYIEKVPVTTVQNVTVDEGCYQMVWVPKPVTRQIAKTTMTAQIRTRAVPIQVTRQIPQTTTRLVPLQTVRLVTESVPTASILPSPALRCASTSSAGLTPLAASLSSANTPLDAEPIIASAGGDWQPVSPRISAESPAMNSGRVPAPMEDAQEQSTRPASAVHRRTPSAARVWSARQ